MARASLITQARGTRVHSTGTHRRLDRMPTPEAEARVSWDDGRMDTENDSASFERMMRANKGQGL